MKKKMMAAHSDLLRKFMELAFDDSAEVRWQESTRAEADEDDGTQLPDTAPDRPGRSG